MKQQEEKKDNDEASRRATTCDYLVIGAGATGMAFVDSLLAHSAPPPSILMVDKHANPGGQWNDSYSFVQLHQPSKGYGVESERLEPLNDTGHLATREEILTYYENVSHRLEKTFDFRFKGERWFDFSQLNSTQLEDDGSGTCYRLQQPGATTTTVRVLKKVVDARYLEPDLPVHVAPKFTFDPKHIHCVPVNALSDESSKPCSHYVVVGGGKTGMDAIVYLQTRLNIKHDDIMWVVPNDAWITARENIGSCMEFLHTCTEIAKAESSKSGKSLDEIVTSEDFFQEGFLQWERMGKVYRLSNEANALPTKFKDATLCKHEMTVINKVTRVIRHCGRVKAIRDNGDLEFKDNTTAPLPWTLTDTTFVHASAGAFNYSKHPEAAPPVFGDEVISIQDVYGTPGFCFVGSLFGKLESLGDKLSNDEKNEMCLAPQPDPMQAKQPLGPSGGDVGVISSTHGYVQRACNLKKWLGVPELKQWLVGHRLFNLGHLDEEQMVGMVEQIMEVLVEVGLVSST